MEGNLEGRSRGVRDVVRSGYCTAEQSFQPRFESLLCAGRAPEGLFEWHIVFCTASFEQRLVCHDMNERQVASYMQHPVLIVPRDMHGAHRLICCSGPTSRGGLNSILLNT